MRDSSDAVPRFTHWPWWRRWFGLRSERLAARYLRQLGWRIIAANVRTWRHELDLIAWDDPEVVIVEVRSTESHDLESIALSITADKQRRISQAAVEYLHAHRLLGVVGVRFDVLLIGWPHRGTPIVRHIRHAFDSVGQWQIDS